MSQKGGTCRSATAANFDLKPGRYPTWDEIADARYQFVPNDLTMAMLLPPREQYVNLHETTFHLHEITTEEPWAMKQSSPRLVAFLEWLRTTADPNELCSPPGIGGLWRAKHIDSGLKRGVIVAHHDDQGLAFVIPKVHGVCTGCAVAKARSLCDHCQCALCIWEREAEERSSPRASQQTVRELALRMRAFKLAAGAQSPAAFAD
jgi:hypothetical protein